MGRGGGSELERWADKGWGAERLARNSNGPHRHQPPEGDGGGRGTETSPSLPSGVPGWREEPRWQRDRTTGRAVLAGPPTGTWGGRGAPRFLPPAPRGCRGEEGRGRAWLYPPPPPPTPRRPQTLSTAPPHPTSRPPFLAAKSRGGSGVENSRTRGHRRQPRQQIYLLCSLSPRDRARYLPWRPREAAVFVMITGAGPSVPASRRGRSRVDPLAKAQVTCWEPRFSHL